MILQYHWLPECFLAAKLANARTLMSGVDSSGVK
jgi:hypothetical protein